MTRDLITAVEMVLHLTDDLTHGHCVCYTCQLGITSVVVVCNASLL